MNNVNSFLGIIRFFTHITYLYFIVNLIMTVQKINILITEYGPILGLEKRVLYLEKLVANMSIELENIVLYTSVYLFIIFFLSIVIKIKEK